MGIWISEMNKHQLILKTIFNIVFVWSASSYEKSSMKQNERTNTVNQLNFQNL